ncbi:hypothetical protein BN2497_12383 [Janthinobacterium sp. CG23_2]|nr:hypothetical protein BN2497_12383 [Janthinobacterium sp. CG23_2]CUU32589.1 hypothetical protein BN3177_12383 [Janthinobacterium sp. CG23_2]
MAETLASRRQARARCRAMERALVKRKIFRNVVRIDLYHPARQNFLK